MTCLGLGLADVGDYQAALKVHEAQLTMGMNSEENQLAFKHNIARCYLNTGRLEEAARLFRLIYRRTKDLHGIHHELTLVATSQLAFTLIKLERYTEVKALTIPYIKTTRDTSFRIAYARALYKNEAASHDDVFQAGTILCDMLHKNQQQFPGLREVLGPSHPLVLEILSDLERVSMMLEDRSRAT